MTESIIDLTARVFNIPYDEIVNHKRQRPIVTARHTAIYMMRLLTNQSLLEVGGQFGKRSPATVSHAFQQIATKRLRDKSLSAKIWWINNQFKGEK